MNLERIIACLAIAQVGHAFRLDATSLDGTNSSEMCCCRTSFSETGCGAGGHFYGCMAFHKKPKCCKSMAKCEAKSGFSWLINNYHNEADRKLCTGNLNLDVVRTPTTDLGFFDELSKDSNKNPTLLSRDYTIMIDQSGSMSSTEWTNVPEAVAMKMGSGFRAGRQKMSLWNEAGIAAAYLADAATQVDPDGISLIFFDSQVTTYENVKSDKQVLSLFKQRAPRGTTGLTAALEEALQPDTMGRAETVLVITDGAPNKRHGVENAIVDAARQLCRDEDLAITFLQVGSASSATEFLKFLDDDLQSKWNIYDIVDTMTKEQMQGKSFLDIIEAGISD